MFRKISPQKVIHTDGYTIQVVDRYRVEYVEVDRRTFVEVDFAKVIGIYRSTLKGWITEKGHKRIHKEEREFVLQRIADGLRFMGSEVEFC